MIQLSKYEVIFGQALRYVRAVDINGNTWDTPIVVEASAGTPGLFLVAGYPAIIHARSSTIRYVVAQDRYGASWNPSVVIDSLTTGGSYWYFPVIANEHPAVAYYDVTNGDLRFAIPRQY